MRRSFLSACFGNFFEHYDTALFGCLSLILAPLIFPKEDPITALILTYGMIPLGMIARPLGALFFGSIGDRLGREQALFLTLSGMGVISFAMAFTPTYDQVGILAPLIFCLGRIGQNFLSSGQTMGGAIFLLENTKTKNPDFISGLYSASTIGGILLASLGVSLLYHFEITSSGWRFLYLLGSLTALFGALIRKNLPKSPPKESSAPLVKTFYLFKKEILLIAIGSGFSYANYSVSLVLMNGFIPLISQISEEEMMKMNTALLVFDFCALPLFGWLSSKVSREKMMLLASLLATIAAIPLMNFLPQATLITVFGIRMFFVLIGVAFFAPFHAFAQEMVPKAHRYQVISFGYAIGCQVLGGLTAPLSLLAFKKTGLFSSIVWYWCLLGLMSSLSLVFIINQKKKAQTNFLLS